MVSARPYIGVLLLLVGFSSQAAPRSRRQLEHVDPQTEGPQGIPSHGTFPGGLPHVDESTDNALPQETQFSSNDERQGFPRPPPSGHEDPREVHSQPAAERTPDGSESAGFNTHVELEETSGIEQSAPDSFGSQIPPDSPVDRTDGGEVIFEPPPAPQGEGETVDGQSPPTSGRQDNIPNEEIPHQAHQTINNAAGLDLPVGPPSQIDSQLQHRPQPTGPDQSIQDQQFPQDRPAAPGVPPHGIEFEFAPNPNEQSTDFRPAGSPTQFQPPNQQFLEPPQTFDQPDPSAQNPDQFRPQPNLPQRNLEQPVAVHPEPARVDPNQIHLQNEQPEGLQHEVPDQRQSQKEKEAQPSVEFAIDYQSTGERPQSPQQQQTAITFEVEEPGQNFGEEQSDLAQAPVLGIDDTGPPRNSGQPIVLGGPPDAKEQPRSTQIVNAPEPNAEVVLLGENSENVQVTGVASATQRAPDCTDPQRRALMTCQKDTPTIMNIVGADIGTIIKLLVENAVNVLNDACNSYFEYVRCSYLALGHNSCSPGNEQTLHAVFGFICNETKISAIARQEQCYNEIKSDLTAKRCVDEAISNMAENQNRDSMCEAPHRIALCLSRNELGCTDESMLVEEEYVLSIVNSMYPTYGCLAIGAEPIVQERKVLNESPDQPTELVQSEYRAELPSTNEFQAPDSRETDDSGLSQHFLPAEEIEINPLEFQPHQLQTSQHLVVPDHSVPDTQIVVANDGAIPVVSEDVNTGRAEQQQFPAERLDQQPKDQAIAQDSIQQQPQPPFPREEQVPQQIGEPVIHEQPPVQVHGAAVGGETEIELDSAQAELRLVPQHGPPEFKRDCPGSLQSLPFYELSQPFAPHANFTVSSENECLSACYNDPWCLSVHVDPSSGLCSTSRVGAADCIPREDSITDVPYRSCIVCT